MDTYQDFDFPAEIRGQPQPLVAFIGLNVTNNSIHKNIWEMFSLNRHTDRVSMKFSLLPADFVPPVLKPKRASYEWYAPKGILKTNWLNKHLQLIPSVIVLFYELDWDDPRWAEKKLECASQLHGIRTSIEGRHTKIAVVLIQKSSHLMNVVTEDNLSTERASELCTTCDLNPKLLLLLLHHSEHLQGYIVRLESAFHELAQGYYTQQIRNIKTHKDYLNKTSHQYLLVRHQFKIAFFNEMKHDLSTAHKSYIQANSSLFELKMSDQNLNEIRTVAAFITYKLCKIYFALSQPRDAISQFNTHVDRFRPKVSPQELLFEHYAWLSKQFMVFGNLFEEATRLGLPAVQTRHPGFYYEQAAQYAIQRKQLLSTMIKEPIQYPENDPLVGWDKVEFYGQRPWRLNNRSEAMEVAREKMALTALQYREKNVVNHSALIVGYLSKAISQFKSYRSPRKRIHLAVQMADEYYDGKEYGQALTLFTHMLWEYRNDKWWRLTVDVLRKALNCAYLTASLQEYVERGMEAAYLFSDEEKHRVMANIISIIQNKCPEPEPGLPETDCAAASEAWTLALQTSALNSINVDMYSVTSFILCKAVFTEANCDAVSLEIWFRNEFLRPLTFSQMAIGIVSQTRNTEFVVAHEKDSSEQSKEWLEMNSGDIKRIPFTFVPSAADVGHDIQLKYVSLTLGSGAESRPINLRFTGMCSDSDVLEREDSHLILSSKVYSNFARLQSKLTIAVEPRPSLLRVSIEHDAPSLNGEWYPMKVVLQNDESTAIKNAVLHVTLVPFTLPPSTLLTSPITIEPPKTFLTEIFEDVNGPVCAVPYFTPVGEIPANEMKTKVLYFKTMAVDSKNVAFKVEYQSVNVAGEDMSCQSEHIVKLDCVNAFEITASFLSPKCEHLSKIYVDHTILMRVQIDCVSPWSIRVEETKFKLLDEYVDWHPEQYVSCLKNYRLRNAEIGVEAIAYVIKKLSGETGTALGSFLIYWRRENDKDNAPVVCTEVQLPQIKVVELPLSVDVNVESPSWVRTPLPMSLVLRNNSQQLMSFDMSIEHVDVDAFMFSGCKQMSFNVLPGGKQSISYNLFPLHAGYLPLPHIRLTVHTELITQTEVSDLVRRTLPSCIFVLPQKKGDADQSNVPTIFTES